ncbi:MAG: HAD family phosphatase [Faecalicatena sp.]|uniref:HAD family hydrolase n=1 Tax=Faecalicatena sp. TaxID=2005360 RepID=UPI00258F933B|nr:HAD family phosphatase [Faecalicatena sp.]MCI6466692.1 HAD family phosphatase [Faecalicatena sp.]MDY5620666.1 HAD family phosphatase [Lachnospiraceae bacterium]
MIRTIILDIGNVLAEYNWKSYLDTFPYPAETKKLLADVLFLSPEWNEFDRGALSHEQLVEMFVQKAPEYEQELKEVLKDVGGCIHQFPYAISWIKSLKEAGFHVYVLSNYGEYMYEHTQKELSFLEFTDGGILSYREKLIKPEPMIYKTLLERYQIHPEEAVFLDDSLPNVEAAKALGIHGIHFTSYEKAVAELETLGVVTG